MRSTLFRPKANRRTAGAEAEAYSALVGPYAQRGSDGSGETSTGMANSGAKITVYSGNTLLAIYDIPTNSMGTVWHVFDYDFETGRLITVNTFTTGTASEVGSETSVIA